MKDKKREKRKEKRVNTKGERDRQMKKRRKQACCLEFYYSFDLLKGSKLFFFLHLERDAHLR